MATWTEDELRSMHAGTELQIETRRMNGTLRPAIPIWHAVVGDALYIRSAHGPGSNWLRQALRTRTGRVSAGGVRKDVSFERADPSIRAQLDAALHAKCDRFGPGPVGAITGDDVLTTTLRVMPRD